MGAPSKHGHYIGYPFEWVIVMRYFQSQQLFSRASWAQKQVFAGTMSALELLLLNKVD